MGNLNIEILEIVQTSTRIRIDFSIAIRKRYRLTLGKRKKRLNIYPKHHVKLLTRCIII